MPAYTKEESGKPCHASGAKYLDTGGEDTKGPKLGSSDGGGGGTSLAREE